MPIEGGLRGKLTVGTKLIAKYKGKEYMATVVETAGGKPGFRLEDGRQFRSPSAAASAVMGGQAANGWRVWSLEGEATAPPTKAATRDVKPDTAATPQAAGTGAQDAATAKVQPQCARCGKSFVGAAQLAHHEASADRCCTPA